MIDESDSLHALAYHSELKLLELAPKPVAPIYVTIPGGKRVPQYAPTVRTPVAGFDPSRDCDGNFASSKFQPNNNCYNYACNIATSSFAQPGRLHGLLHGGPPDGNTIAHGAQLDGLVLIDKTILKPSELKQTVHDPEHGHFVALMISPADPSIGWPGDYHWVRSDDRSDNLSWSQKDGGDQVTNFDFAGAQISDPQAANWTVNQGPIISGDQRDVYIAYDFFCYMFVPEDTTDII